VSEHDPVDRRGTAGRTRPGLATLLAALCLLTLVVGTALTYWVKDHSPDRPDSSPLLSSAVADEDADRLAVIQATERFTETFNNFSAKDPQGYIDKVKPLLSTKFRTDFTGSSQDVITGITQQKLSSRGKVLTDDAGIPLVAVASLDPDSAQALVAADARRTDAGQTVLRHWRWQVSLVKVGDDWLVDSFKEV
jgi:hypothetical protein